LSGLVVFVNNAFGGGFPTSHILGLGFVRGLLTQFSQIWTQHFMQLVPDLHTGYGDCQ
jgi:hypothetical protein